MKMDIEEVIELIELWHSSYANDRLLMSEAEESYIECEQVIDFIKNNCGERND